jgi:hypothetical protein
MNALTWKQQRVRELETHIALERIKLDLFEAELEQLSKLTGYALIFRYSYEMEADEKATEKYMEIMRAAMILTKPDWKEAEEQPKETTPVQ